jgi:multiple sugar transport system permease protein
VGALAPDAGGRAGTLARRPARRRRRPKPTRALRYLILAAGGVLFVAPFAYMVSSSFQPLSQIFSYPPKFIPTDPTLDNYRQFFGSGHQIGRWILNSTFTTAAITIAQLFFSSLVAYTFAKRTFPGRDLLFFVMLATMMLPIQITIIPNYLILKGIPLFGGNDIMGIGGHGWLDSYWGVIVPNLVNPFGIFLLRQYMKSIPDELLDAARIDGAGHFRIFWQVVLPLSRPALAALAIFTFQFWWSAFFWPLIVLSSPSLYTLPLGLALFQEANRTAWNLIMAGSTLGAIPLIAAFLIFQRQFVRGIALSGMKG